MFSHMSNLSTRSLLRVIKVGCERVDNAYQLVNKSASKNTFPFSLLINFPFLRPI
jgi:hypothetical protein